MLTIDSFGCLAADLGREQARGRNLNTCEGIPLLGANFIALKAFEYSPVSMSGGQYM